VTYHPKITGLASILRDNYYNIIENTDAKKIIPEPPIVAYKQPTNLKSFIVHSKLDKIKTPQTSTNNHKCNRPRCKSCPIFTETNIFTNQVTQKSIKIKNGGNCISKNCIYAITCNDCKQVNIGQTSQTLSERISGHQSDIKLNNKLIETAEHFKKSSHSGYTITILDRNEKWDVNDRLFFEDFYISKLKTLHPNGMNRRHNDMVKYFYAVV